MPPINLTGTSYLKTTDDLIGMADERLIIEAADDRKAPDTTAKSFDELAAGDATVRGQIIAVLSEVVAEAEGEVEAFARGLYALPLAPLDLPVKNLVRDWTWYKLRVRRGMFRTEADKREAENALTSRGQRIRNSQMILTSVLVAQGEGANELVYDFGTSDRVAFRDPLPAMTLYPWRK